MIDLRSDTVTTPDEGMRESMANAAVGDDVYGEDPTVNRLEARMAEMSGHEKGLFVPSGTQSNLIALMTHCTRGEEYIVGQNAHTYRYEAGGAAVLGSIQPQPIEFEVDGTLDLDKVASKIKPDDFHFAKTRLLALENTVGGQVISQAYIQSAGALARDHGLNFHLDGARIMNAVVAQNIELRDIAGLFDSVSVCLSKGLGAPVGSVLLGDSRFIEQGRRWRKMLGGGMRQAGILAAACLYALDNNIQQLSVDHDNAQLLAQSLQAFEQIDVVGNAARTNMVFASVNPEVQQKLIPFMQDNNVCMSPGPQIRLVLHRNISREDVQTVVGLFEQFFENNS